MKRRTTPYRILLTALCLMAIAGSLAAECKFYGYNTVYAVPLVASYQTYAALAPTYGTSYAAGYGSGYSGGCGMTGYGTSGKSYWPGGYYKGDSRYASGYYAPGYYQDYAQSYTPSYKAQSYVNHVVEPVFYRFTAFVPIAEQPTYGSYYLQPPGAGAYGSASTAASGYSPAASTAAPSSMDAKLDRLLALATNTDGKVNRLEARVNVLEGSLRPGTPPPTPTPGTPPPDPRPAPAPSPTPAASPEKPDVPTLMFSRCASCHDGKTAAKHGANKVYFVAGDGGAEMATYGPGGKVTPLSVITLRKIVKVLADGSMPPKEDADGKPATADKLLTDAQRKEAIAFFEQAIATGPK